MLAIPPLLLHQVCLIPLKPRKHRYGKNPAVPVPGTSWVRILPGYCCMRNPGVPIFGQKKNFRYGFGTGWVRIGSGPVRGGVKLRQNGVVLREISNLFIFFTRFLATRSPLQRLSLSSLLLIPPPPVHSVLSFSLPHSTGDGLQHWIILDLRATTLDHLGSEGDLRATASKKNVPMNLYSHFMSLTCGGQS